MPFRDHPYNDFPYQDYPYHDFPYRSYPFADQPRQGAKKPLTMNKRVNANPGLILSLVRLIAAIFALPFRIVFTLFFRLHKKS